MFTAIYLGGQSTGTDSLNITQHDSDNLNKTNIILQNAQEYYEKSMNLSQQNVEFASKLIDWVALLLTFLAFVIAIGAYFGLKEYRQIKETVEDIKKIKEESKLHLKEVVDIKLQTELSLQEIKQEFISKSETFMIASFNYNIGAQAYKIGDFERSLEYFLNAYTYNPNDVHILCRVGRSLCNLDRNYHANEYFQKALAIDKNSHEALSGLATSMRFINLGEAINYCKKSLLLKPNDVFLHDYLGLLYRDNEEINLSLDCHKESIRIDPNSSVSYFYLSLIEAKLNKKNESLASMNLSLEKVHQDKNLRPVWVQAIKSCNLVLNNQLDIGLNEYIKLKELIKNNSRVQKAVLSHIEFLLVATQLKEKNNELLKFLTNE